MLASCGGGGGGGGDLSQMVGQFIDDPVGGLTYSCISAGSTQTITGTTDADGHFNYITGQTCTFKVGNVTLGTLNSVPSDGKVTPQDVAGVSRSATASPSALAIAQFLQSLNDGTTSGKIAIPAATATALSSVTAITLASNAGTVSQSDLQTVVAAAGKTLVSAATAKSALDTQISSGNVVASLGSVSGTAPVVLNSIAVDSAAPSNAAGLTVQMTATGYFSDGSTKDLTSSVTWSSSDTSMATVSASGMAKGLMKGIATITASLTPSGSTTAVKGSVVQTTTDPVLQTIAITNSNTLPAGLTDQLKAMGYFSDGSTSDLTKTVSWTSSDSKTLTVDPNGLVSGLVKGNANLTATAATTGITAIYSESVLDPTPVNLAIYYLTSGVTSIQDLGSTTLQAILKFTDASTKIVSSMVNWVITPSSSGGNATIGMDKTANTATLTGTAPGSVTISANYTNSNQNSSLASTNTLSLSVTPLTGSFIDDPVSGLTYMCTSSGNSQTYSGTTDAAGNFNYVPGQTCIFKVGNVTIGSMSNIPTDGVVTPQDVAGVSRSATSDPTAVAIAQFLQTLDDGTGNGNIVIPASVTTALSSSSVSPLTLASSTSGVVPQNTLASLVQTVGQSVPAYSSKTLVSASTATSALQAQITSGKVNVSTGAVNSNSPVTLTSILVSSSASSNPAGISEQLTATGNYSDGTTRDLTSKVTWSSSDTSILTVDSTGNAVGVTKGSAVVTASITPTSSTASVNGTFTQGVTDPTILNIVIATVSNAIQYGATTTLTAIETLSNNVQKSISSLVDWVITSVTGNGSVAVDKTANTATLTGTASGAFNVVANYLGVSSNSVNVTVAEQPIFNTQAILLPDVSAKYQSLCGNQVGIQTGITANLAGHKDGKKDLIFTLWCAVPSGTNTTSPTVNGLIAFVQQADGSFIDATKSLFGVDLLDVGGGVATGAIAYDFNNDGFDEVFISVTGEDGRSLPTGYTGNNRKNLVITSKSDGTYTSESIGTPAYNFMIKVVNGISGAKDVLTASIGYGGSDQAYRYVSGQWQLINDYAGAPGFSNSFFSSTGFNGNVDSVLAPSASNATISLFQKQANGSWVNKDSQSLGSLVRTATFKSWNGDMGTMPIMTYNNIDYGFISFSDNCLMRSPTDSSYFSLFAVPAQKVVGGYTAGRLLTESNPSDFSLNLIVMGYAVSNNLIKSVPLNIKNFKVDANFYALKCADINSDGNDDFWVNNWGSGQKPAFYLSDGSGNYSLVDQARIPLYPNNFNGALAIYEDIDGDGIKDLLYYPITGLNGSTAKVQYPMFKGLRKMRESDLAP